jgi:hypothetical protein
MHKAFKPQLQHAVAASNILLVFEVPQLLSQRWQHFSAHA